MAGGPRVQGQAYAPTCNIPSGSGCICGAETLVLTVTWSAVGPRHHQGLCAPPTQRPATHFMCLLNQAWVP